MAKRGRKPKNPPILSLVDPQVAREGVGLLVAALAFILILAQFNLAGGVGAAVFGWLKGLFGLVAHLIALWIAFAAGYIFKPNISRRARMIFWGSLIFMLLLAGLISKFNTAGGAIGDSIFLAFSTLFSDIGAFIILLVLALAAIIFTFNVSLADLFQGVKLPRREADEGVKVREKGVPLFKLVRRKIDNLGSPGEKRPSPAPSVSTPDGTWQFPSVELLEESSGKAQAGNVTKNVDILKKTLADFGVEVSAGVVNVGPTVTQYELKPSEGVKLNTIKARADDLALALAAHPVRVEAPIPGKSAVGVEVPNRVVAKVALRELLDSEAFRKRTSNLSLPLGMDVAGDIIVADLKKMPHLLVAGATGSGKSVNLNSVILSLLFQNSPRDLRLLLVDPKRVEFTDYNGIPHLYTPVVVEVDKTINLLRWAISEMDRRFRLFEETGSRDIGSYNEKIKKGFSSSNGTHHEKMPCIVIIIDELADLMAQAANEVEAAIVRLAQMARATGIHLVVATQRPSVDVITGLIKANITSRVAFSVASQVDSRTIIDQAGAEKLLGNGDMLFIGGEYSKPKRVQGAFVSEKDIKAVCGFLKSEGSATYDDTITEYREVSGIKSRRRASGSEDDEMLPEARKLVIESATASASFLQRRLKVGYARAARLLDLMEAEGTVGPSRGAKPRDILVDSSDDWGGGSDHKAGL